jgi:hypothetical protein
VDKPSIKTMATNANAVFLSTVKPLSLDLV